MCHSPNTRVCPLCKQGRVPELRTATIIPFPKVPPRSDEALAKLFAAAFPFLIQPGDRFDFPEDAA